MSQINRTAMFSIIIIRYNLYPTVFTANTKFETLCGNFLRNMLVVDGG